MTASPAPFAAYLGSSPAASPLRDAIAAHARAPEPACVLRLAAAAALPQAAAQQAEATARRLVAALRQKGTPGPVQGLVREYGLSSQEGVALMCLAEALLRIPDRPTRDALIRDKIGAKDWRAHLGHSPSLFVNAATWGLVVSGRLVGTVDEAGLASALTRLVARGGEPVIRKGVDIAMRLMGEQFVTGETIEDALRNSRRLEAQGFRYSYDMLGEAATTAEDAARYLQEYEAAIRAIGRHAAGAGVYDRPGISVKLSALHPRYTRAQRERVMAELLPRLAGLATLARQHGIGLNIDAEEADRLELSLDLLEALCFDPRLAGWDGIGFVVQAYQKRAPFVLDWVIDLARRSGHRLMIRLVKGAYWDSEIKRAQVDGLAGFPVYTRKVHTDVSYLACARMLLGAADAVFPQFATHNAHTVAAIHALAGPDFQLGQYEFQCLHGMGEPLYAEVVGHNALNRPCRIYAPVGTHETLLAYLVRRLLENGANSSFVNRIQEAGVPVEELVADPVALALAGGGAPHPAIALPRALYGAGRANSAGLDLADEPTLRALAARLRAEAQGGTGSSVRNPADARDVVGHSAAPGPAAIEAALLAATQAAPGWATTPPERRAAILDAAADALQAEMPALIALLVREAGKTTANAVSEVREATDFLRYDAAQLRAGFDPATHVPLGPVLCISPWNFPLAIFTGQVAAALAAGNTVLAKPAEQTPLIAARAIAMLHAAGVPAGALHLLPGDGRTGAALVADGRLRGVLFTGSTAVAKQIQAQLATRLNPDGAPVPLVAETGGQNAMIVDSSALTEQVVTDVLASAFDSAGQRCSALRLLCVQEEVASRTLAMLKGALAELAIGNPDRLATDIGPVIDAEARDAVLAHIAAMRAAGRAVYQAALPAEAAHGTFVAPAIIEIGAVGELTREVFGPVLHVLRYRRDALDALLADIRATGYGLTFGVHTRIGEMAERCIAGAAAGNIYVNRNIVGAVVGVQPFGGHGLSGTGPKAGGPLYLRRLLAQCPPATLPAPAALPGPVGEENLYSTAPRGRVFCRAASAGALRRQVEAALATGNRALVEDGPGLPPGAVPVPPGTVPPCDAVLFEGPATDLVALARELAERDGPIVPVHVARAGGAYPAEWLVQERVVSTNTTAAGGNATLMAIG